MSRAVSNAYLVAINAPVEQAMFLAEFGFVPPGAREGLTLSQSGFGRWGDRRSQLNNRVYGMGAKWGSLELNRTILGGNWRYIDPTTEQQTGEWGESQSGTDGSFSSPPFVEQTLDQAYDLIGIQIIFDDLGEEWATRVRVSYYNASHVLLAQQTFSNAQANMPVNWPYNGVRYIRVELLAWSLPRRFAKVCQIIPGQIRYFNDDNTFSFHFKEKTSPFESLTIPEYTIVFSNENQEYNIINPTGLVSKLRELMEIPSSIGLVTAAGVEYVSTGNFPLFSWPDSANDETAAFICRPDLALANGEYSYALGATITVAQAAATISTQARLKVPVAVDASLRNIQVNGNIGDRVPLHSALGQLAIAAGGYIKFERDGSYSLKPIAYPAPVRSLSYDALWGKPGITQRPLVAGIKINYLAYSGEKMQSQEYLLSTGSTGKIFPVNSGFIRSEAEAQRIANIALQFYNKRLSYKIDFRGDMSIEAGDTYRIETDYGLRNVWILGHEISYDTKAFLQGKIEGIEI